MATFTKRLPAVLLVLAVLGVLLAAPAAKGLLSTREADHIAEVLALVPGLAVADVGAGHGEWSLDLARRVGSEGRVWATEVNDEDLAEIRRRIAEAGVENVTVVRGDQHDTGLPEACCDAVLVRMVYHHFTDPPAMRKSLRRALRPGGRLAVIDIEPQKSWRRLQGVPERGGHGIPAEELIQEMVSDGFEVVSRHEDWNRDDDRYCIVFRRSSSESPPAAP